MELIVTKITNLEEFANYCHKNRNRITQDVLHRNEDWFNEGLHPERSYELALRDFVLDEFVENTEISVENLTPEEMESWLWEFCS